MAAQRFALGERLSAQGGVCWVKGRPRLGAQNPTRQVHALLARFHFETTFAMEVSQLQAQHFQCRLQKTLFAP